MEAPNNDQLPERVFSINEISLLDDPFLFREFSDFINHLIRTDFQKLVWLLYRVDVNEKYLKEVLRDNPGKDAGDMIATLILQRQAQKIKSRQENNRDENNISGEERW
jgi:hypothetical protein